MDAIGLVTSCVLCVCVCAVCRVHAKGKGGSIDAFIKLLHHTRHRQNGPPCTGFNVSGIIVFFANCEDAVAAKTFLCLTLHGHAGAAFQFVRARQSANRSSLSKRELFAVSSHCIASIRNCARSRRDKNVRSRARARATVLEERASCSLAYRIIASVECRACSYRWQCCASGSLASICVLLLRE